MPKTRQTALRKPVYSMQWINSSHLTILGNDYQRELNEGRINKIVSEFDEMIANEPKVSYRNGCYYVFDGQHTIAARKVMNNGIDLPILCKVYSGLTEKKEALLFAMQNGTATKPTPGERMRAWVFGKEPEAIAFKKATESTGIVLEMTDVNCPYHLRCISTALWMYRTVGEDFYVEALNVIADAWEGNTDSLKLEIVIAVCKFIQLYNDVYDRDRLVWRLRAVDPITIRNNIKTDLELVGVKKHINQIFQIYNGNGKQVIEQRF